MRLPQGTHPFAGPQFVDLGRNDERIPADGSEPCDGLAILVGHDPAVHQQDDLQQGGSTDEIVFNQRAPLGSDGLRHSGKPIAG